MELVQMRTAVTQLMGAVKHANDVADGATQALVEAAAVAVTAWRSLDADMSAGGSLPPDWEYFWRVGEPDPTRAVKEQYPNGKLCLQRVRGEHRCTRLSGHGGDQHVSGDGQVVVAVSKDGA